MSDLSCSIVTPSSKVFEGNVKYIYAPGKIGEFGALAGHENFITILDIGVVGIEKENGEKEEFLIVDGYFEVSDDKVIIIADEAYKKEDINKETAEKKANDYKNRLLSLNYNDPEFKKIQHKYDKYSKMLKFAS